MVFRIKKIQFTVRLVTIGFKLQPQKFLWYETIMLK